MRTVRGVVTLPPDAPPSVARLLLVEARDVSIADAPSLVVGVVRTADVPLGPGRAIPFELEVPEAAPGHTLALRAHASLDGTERVAPGDAISTVSLPLPDTGDVPSIEVPLRTV
jgi:hypothetical protein